jgi:choline dehydrogenase-like flavoprotein
VVIEERNVDAVVIGAGASGSLIAAKLARAGKRTLLLDAGPGWTTADLISSPIWSRRLKWDAGTTTTGAQPINVGFNAGCGFGGSALHHYACWFRLHPEDFRMRSLYGRGQDWPISYDELRPFYDQVQREMGLSGDATAEVWRPTGDPYPMPPLALSRQGEAIAKGFAALGMRTSPMPQAINSVEYNGRPACIYDGWCDAGCPIGALANPLVTYLPQAARAGAEIRPMSTVTRILPTRGKRPDRVSGVAYVNAAGEERRVTASVVVLAAFSVQTPRLLLASATDRFPDGLANSSGVVGRYMMAHISGDALGLFPGETAPYTGVTGGSLLCQDSYDGKAKADYFGSYQWLIARVFKPTDLLGVANTRPELFGEALHRFLRTAARHLGAVTLLGEDLPDPDNRVVLSAERDRFGVPRAVLTHRYAPDTLRLHGAAMEQGMLVLRAAGASEAWAAPMAQQHVLGGTIMGSDPARSVANGFGQAHDHENLFLAGPGLFPTSGAVNPTFTVSALALRTADYLVRNWSSLI